MCLLGTVPVRERDGHVGDHEFIVLCLRVRMLDVCSSMESIISKSVNRAEEPPKEASTEGHRSTTPSTLKYFRQILRLSREDWP